MKFKDGALEILHRVGLAVEITLLLELVADRVALLGQAAVLLPVVPEAAADPMPRLGEELAMARRLVRHLARRARGAVLDLVAVRAQLRQLHLERRIRAVTVVFK